MLELKGLRSFHIHRNFTILLWGLLFFFVSATPYAENGRELDRYPGSGNIIFNLHSSLKRYFDRLRENTVHYSNGQGCEVYGENYRVCAESLISKTRDRLTNRVYILGGDQTFLSFVVIHEGERLMETPLEELWRFNFRLRGRKFTYQISGIRDLRLTFEKISENGAGEKGVLFYPPLNYLIKIMHLDDGVSIRKKYLSSCVYCSGPEWFEARAIRRPGRPHDLKFYNSEVPESITPREFDSLLSTQFYRPLTGLGSSLVRELVSQGSFPDLKF